MADRGRPLALSAGESLRLVLRRGCAPWCWTASALVDDDGVVRLWHFDGPVDLHPDGVCLPGVWCMELGADGLCPSEDGLCGPLIRPAVRLATPNASQTIVEANQGEPANFPGGTLVVDEAYRISELQCAAGPATNVRAATLSAP